jgi:hypothetical protein
MAASFDERQASGNDAAEQLGGEFSRCATRFETQAAQLSRGLHTALLVQRFKRGLLRVRGRA